MKRFLLITLFLLLIPVTGKAAWTDNLILHIPFTDPNNPLQVLVGSGSITYTSSSSATYIHPTTGLVTISTTNFGLQSEDLTGSAWTTSSASVVADQATSPDGTVSADQLIVGAAGDGSVSHSATMTVGSTAITAVSETYTASVYVKANSNTWINLELIGKNGASHNCYFNTSTGAIGSCFAIEAASATAEANGFYRFSVSGSLGPTTGVTPKLRVYLASADGTKTFTGNGTNSVYVWGAQINSGLIGPYVKTTSAPVSTPRIESGGILLEGLRKNQLTWSRDLATSTWIKTNMTATKTATGRDGVSNAASVITASADNATVCQAITLASASTSVSADIKRISGSGAVTLSADGGSTYGTDVSGSLSTTDWYRAYKENQVLTNPSFCIKLATNGDSVAVDYTQLESAAFISSRIPTASTTISRYIDKISLPSANNWASSTGSFFVIADTWDTSTSNKFIMDAGGNPTKIPMHIRSAQGNGAAGILGRTTTYEGTECSYSSVNVQPKTSTKMASRWDKPNNTRGTTASGGSFTNCTFTATLGMAASSSLVLGDAYLQDGTRTLWGHMKSLRAWDTALSESLLSIATAGLTNEIGSVPTVTASSTATTTTTVTLNALMSDTGGENASSRGFTYGTTNAYGATTTESGSFGTGSFTTNLSGLTCNTTYYYRAYATNTAGVGYSSGDSFTTASCPVSVSLPTVTASSTIATTTTTITLNANITGTGNENPTARGFNYGTSIAYGASTTESGSFGIGSFSAFISGLSCNTTYYYRAYATNSAGTGTSTGSTFTTASCPITVTAPSISASSTATTTTTASMQALVTDIGNENASSRGFEYGLTTSYGTTITNSGSFGVGSFASYVSNLTCGTTYHYRAFAINSGGTGRSLDSTFSTNTCPSENNDETSTSTPVVSVARSISSPIRSKSLSAVINSFSTNLRSGSAHAEVKKLQKFLNDQGFIIAKQGPGSKGSETETFGPMTKSALIRFQLAHDIRPAAGFFGPITRKYIESLGY